jgi:HK97 family phage major capsid protein
MASLVEVREELAAKRDHLHKIFEQAGEDMDLGRVTLIDGDTTYKAGEIRRLNDELTGLGTEETRLSHLELIAQQNSDQYKRLHEPAGRLPMGNGGGPARSPRRELRQALEDNRQYKAFRDGQTGNISIELPYPDFKTLVQLSTATPQADRRDVVQMALEERTVADLMLQGTMDSSQIDYFEETTFTNAADTVAEGGTKQESTVAYTLRTETARKIAHNIPATKESLDDISFLETQLRGRLAFGVRRAEESQLLNGSVVSPDIIGLLNRTGIQTQAKSTDPTPDAVYKAMQKVRGSAGSGFAEPTAFVINPADWTDIKLLRTTDGIYLWGNPADDAPDRIWGLLVRQTTEIAAGTGLVGAFRPHAEVLRREGITITMSTEHSTYFVENKVMLQAESRLALAVYRPSAFCTVTGI